MKEFDAVMPYDPVNDFAYINGIGTNETEAMVNIDLCESSDDVIKRIVYVPVKVVMPTST